MRPRWVFAGLGLLTLASWGVSIASQPEFELLYQAEPPLEACTDSGCIHVYSLELGNTGRRELREVRLRLHEEMCRRAILRPTVRNFGKVDRPVDVTIRNGVRSYDLGSLAPAKRVELRLVLRGEPGQEMPAWGDILVGVEAPGAEVKRGSPAATMLVRVLYAIFGWW